LTYEPVTQILTSNEGSGFTTADFQGRQVVLGDGFAGRAAAERKTLRVDDLLTEETHPRLARALAGEKFTSYLAVPLVAKGELRGVLEIFHSKPLPKDDAWLGRVDALAGRAAIAIDTLKVFEHLERTNKELVLSYDATIEGWSRALDLRDRETEGHSQRVTELAVNLARSMGMKGKDLVNLSRGALLHDIGKMGVPDNILRKEGPLTDEEWVSMRLHPTYARDLLESIGYLQDAIDVPYGHHEKWDGTGYPRGLKGEQIPFAARIFAIVDVYDALTSDRPYRKAWTREKTIEHITMESGTHFDPRVVEAFLALLASPEVIR
jgi:putative nucleotidyltransferase with HDIG domain